MIWTVYMCTLSLNLSAIGLSLLKVFLVLDTVFTPCLNPMTVHFRYTVCPSWEVTYPTESVWRVGGACVDEKEGAGAGSVARWQSTYSPADGMVSVGFVSEYQCVLWKSGSFPWCRSFDVFLSMTKLKKIRIVKGCVLILSPAHYLREIPLTN